MGLKVAFDIGGVISRYPEQMKLLMDAMRSSGFAVYVLTDMNQDDAFSAVEQNGLLWSIGLAYPGLPADPYEFILSADWSAHGDRCKSIVMAEREIDILIDDRPDYCASGDFIGLVLAPRPDVPYYAPEWVSRGTPAVCVPPEEYEEFRRWRSARSEGGS